MHLLKYWDKRNFHVTEQPCCSNYYHKNCKQFWNDSNEFNKKLTAIPYTAFDYNYVQNLLTILQ